MKKLGGLALAAAVLLLAGCSGAEPEATSSPTAEAAPSPTTSQETAITLDELRAEYVAAGGQCERIEPGNPGSVSNEVGECDGGAFLSTYLSASQLDAAIRLLEEQQAESPSPYVVAVGDDWMVSGDDASSVSAAMGGATRQIGAPVASAPFDLSTDAGICEADAALTGLELNDALAPTLGYPAVRDARTPEQDATIRDFKNAAFANACPERVG